MMNANLPRKSRQVKIYKKYLKRVLDVIVSFCAIVALSPLLLVLAVLVELKLGHPAIFRQERPGLNEKIFVLYKFKSMTDEVDQLGQLLDDSQRLTRFGRFLRSTSLDELPELINIFKGDMSLVGPRPLLIQYLPLYDSDQRRRHEVRPGLTGLAQVNGRNGLTWEEKFRYDVEYVDSVSFTADIKILFKTVWKVLKRDGISSATSDTMEAFTGKRVD